MLLDDVITQAPKNKRTSNNAWFSVCSEKSLFDGVHGVAFKRICCFHGFPPVGEILPAVGHDVPGHAVLGGERTRARTESGGVRAIYDIYIQYYISNVNIYIYP